MTRCGVHLRPKRNRESRRAGRGTIVLEELQKQKIMWGRATTEKEHREREEKIFPHRVKPREEGGG